MNESIINLPPDEDLKNNLEKIESSSSMELEITKPDEDPIKKSIREDGLKKDELALNKIRQELGMDPSKKPEISDNKTSERVRMENSKELAKSLTRISNEIQEFEDTLKQNKFNRVPLNADEFKKIIKDEQINFPKAIQVFDDLQRDLSRDFMPKDNEDKLSIESHNFNRVIDSLNRLRGIFSGARNMVEDKLVAESEVDNKKLSDSIQRTINTMRRKADNLEESHTALLRYRGR